MQATGIKFSELEEDSSKGFDIDDEKYFVVKKDGECFVYQNACPHLGIALEWQEDRFLDSSKSMIECANHGALFVIENGLCVSGPCSGQKLASVDFQLHNGEIFITAKN